jgi:hypothetical protein
MTSPDARGANAFLHAPLPGLFLRTAAPIILIMATNGLLAIVDAYFLGEYVGPDALAAVTLMFPAFMLLVALSTLVASGMASQLARRSAPASATRRGRPSSMRTALPCSSAHWRSLPSCSAARSWPCGLPTGRARSPRWATATSPS